MKLARHTPKRGRVEIIPMIDTILILLVFYMSFSTFGKKERRITTKLPAVSAAAAPTQIPLDIVLHVKSRNNVIVNGSTSYDIPTLRDALMQLTTIGQETTVVIEADANTSYQDVISALDVCAQAHLTRVAFRPLAEKVASVP